MQWCESGGICDLRLQSWTPYNLHYTHHPFFSRLTLSQTQQNPLVTITNKKKHIGTKTKNSHGLCDDGKLKGAVKFLTHTITKLNNRI